MVARRMGSQDGGTNANEGNQTETQMVQNQMTVLLGPLSSMDLDELLMSVWTPEMDNNQVIECDGYQTATPQPAPSSGLSLDNNPPLPQPEELSQKTVDEVWQGIQDGQKWSNHDRESAQGETSFDDFLIKAGFFSEPTRENITLCSVTDPVGLPQEARWMSYQALPVHSQPQLPIITPGHHEFALPAFPDTQMFMSSSSLIGTSSGAQMPGRKRGTPDNLARRRERRQKRLIKNRESAARSRARKMLYTHKLESMVSRLEEENKNLKRQQEMEKVLHSVSRPVPRYSQLRRTRSSPP